MITIFSIFNIVLVIDAVGAAAKWLPKSFPKSKEEKKETAKLVRRTSGAGIVTPALPYLKALEAKRKVKSGVHVVIAMNRLSSHASSSSSGKNKRE